MIEGLASKAAVPKTVMIDATYLKAHRTATCLRSKKGGAGDQRGRLIGRTKGGMNTRLHAVTDAAALPGSLPKAEWLLADRSHDADWFRDALKDKGIKPCIPGRTSRGKPFKHDRRRYKRRNRTKIIFGRPKDPRRGATRYDRCPKVFLSAVALAATVLLWI
jgi:transposase